MSLTKKIAQRLAQDQQYGWRSDKPRVTQFKIPTEKPFTVVLSVPFSEGALEKLSGETAQLTGADEFQGTARDERATMVGYWPGSAFRHSTPQVLVEQLNELQARDPSLRIWVLPGRQFSKVLFEPFDFTRASG